MVTAPTAAAHFEPYTANTPVEDVTGDPAMGEWGRLLFPVDAGYMRGSRLGNLSLTWYSSMDSTMTVAICNYVKARALASETVFLDIHTDAEKAADHAKADAGLFFFQGDEGAPTAIVSAGGGFAYVGAMHDSFPHCMELSRRRYNAFALVYRPGAQTACEAWRAPSPICMSMRRSSTSRWRATRFGEGAPARACRRGWVPMAPRPLARGPYPRPAACVVNYTGSPKCRVRSPRRIPPSVRPTTSPTGAPCGGVLSASVPMAPQRRLRSSRGWATASALARAR